jgi:catechol 2,3-dioxygenase-like lactoylglutathione lyase family enzyme
MRPFLKQPIFYLAGAASLFAQSPSPVVGVGTFIHVVADLDKTMRFYGDRLGLELNGAPGPRAFSTNAVVENLYDAKGRQSRVAVFKIPGSALGVEFAEFKDADQKPFKPRLQDPGASVLVLSVPNFNAVMTRLKEDAAPIVSDDGARGTTVKDPDGYFIRLIEGPSGARLSLTVDSMDRTLHLFRDLLGFQSAPEKASSKERSSTAKVPGTSFDVDFIEFKGVDRQSVRAGIHDPGAGVLRLVVRDVDTLLQTLKAAGVPVVSAGGEAVNLGNRQAVILRDPDNFFVQIISQPVPAAK